MDGIIDPMGNTGLGSQEPLVVFVATDQCTTLFYVSPCLKTPYLVYIIDSLTLNSANSTTAWMKHL